MSRVTGFSCAFVAVFIVGVLLSYALFSSSKATAASSKRPTEERMTLDLVGYNYTNHHIEEYYIDNHGAGIVRVSSPTSGGSGSVCCIELTPGKSGAIFVRVHWQVDGCSYTEKDPSGEFTEEVHHYIYKEKYVEVDRPVGIKANHLETHFYPDGTVQVQISEAMSLPRLRLGEDRVEKLNFPECGN